MTINYLTVLVAWIAGATWCGVLSKPWMAALGWTAVDTVDASGKRRMPLGPMLLSLIAEILSAAMLLGLLTHIGRMNVKDGAITVSLVWLGFVVTTIVVKNGFQRRRARLTIIDSDHWLLVFVVQRVVLGLLA